MKLISTIISALLISIAISLSAQNAPVSTLGTVASKASTAVVPITAVNFTNIVSCNLKILYDPAIATPTAVTKGSGLPGTVNFNFNVPGVIRIGWYSSSGETMSSGSVIFNIAFNKKINGTTALVFQDEGDPGLECNFDEGAPDWQESLLDKPFDNYYKPGSLNFNDVAPKTIAPDLTATVGSVISVPVTVMGFYNIGDLSLKLDYDPVVLTFISVVNTGGFDGWISANPSPGRVNVSGSNSNPLGYSLPDDATLFTINFTYNGGTSGLNWYDIGGSCEYTGPFGDVILKDTPQPTYYINGSVGPVAQPPTPTIAVEAITHPTTCGGTDGTMQLSFTNVPDGTYTITYDENGSGSSFTGVLVTSGVATISAPAGTYNNLKITVGGVTSTSDPDVVLTDPAAPEKPVASVTQQTSCTASSGTIIVTSPIGDDITYSYDGSIYHESPYFFGLIPGDYYVTVMNAAGCVSPQSDKLTINPQPPTPAAPLISVTEATCQAAGTATISNYDALYTYTFSPTGPSAGANGVISGFSTDVSYTVTATNISNCTSEASESFMVPAALDAPATPTVEVTAATCEAAGTATITNYNADYTYTFSPEGPTAGANGVISNLAYGTSYTVTAKNISNCTSAASASFSVMNMLPTPDAPAVQVTAATCQAAGTATISNYDALYTYTFSPEGPAAGANGLISGMAYGTSYTVTAKNISNCTSAASASFSIMNMLPTPVTPTVQVTAATCQAAGTATISNYDALYTYTFSPEGPTAGANGLISGMAYGTSYTVTAKNISNCTSAASASFSIMNMLPTPDAPAIQVTAATCQAAGTATISNYDALYTYTFSPAGPSAGANGVISGFSTDVSYTVTATNISNCTSEASESFMVPAALDAPATPTVQVTAATCQAAGTATISNYNANYTYTFSPTGPSAGANGLISGMAYGTSYTVTAKNISNCTSAASASFSIMNMLPTPVTPTIQVTAATCEAAGTATISNYDALYTYTFSPEGPAAGANGVISNLAYGTSYTVTAKNISNCTSGASASFSVMNMLPTPMQPTVEVTAATCEAAGTATISNYDALYTYTFSPEGPTAGANGVISNLAYGTSYTVTAKNISNCTSAASASFSVMNMLPTPMQPTVEVTAATCEAAGTATISNYDALYTYTFSPEGPAAGANGLISGMAYGTSYTVTAKNISNCTSAASASFSIMNMLPTPVTPTVQVTAATCEAAGTATISNYDALYTYTFSPEGPTAGANGLISGMAYGTSYTVTAKNISNCTSAASASFSIMNMLPTPDAPAVQVTAATCQAAGTATISNYDALYTYTFSPAGPSAGANGVISGFSTDVSYTVTATNISNCTSEASESFMVPAALDAPATPTVQVTAATCQAAGTATISNYNANYTYTFSPTGPSAGANGLISGMAYGTSYTVTAKNISNCTSGASASFSVMNMLPTPVTPTIQVTAATCEAAGTATISNYDALYTYTFSPEGPAAGANGVISNLAYGTSYTVTAKNISNCTSGASASFSVMNMLPTPMQPTVEVTAATCEAAGTATISNYDALYTYTFSPEGPTAGANGVISNLAYGTSYTVTAKNISNCTSAASASFSIMNMLPTPDAPTIQVTAATCEAAGTATISNYDALYTYTFSPEGPAAGANGLISGMAYGTSYTVTAKNISNCTSAASASFSIMNMLPTPVTPTVQVTAATCQAAGTATISNYDALYTYTFSPEGPTAGANGVISNLAYGTSYTVTAKNISNCTSAASASFSVMNMLPTPDAPAVQVTAATCQAAGTATISNYDALYTYTFSPEGPAAGANGLISGMAYGTSYTVTAKNISNCTSAASASFSIMNMLPTPVTPTVQVTAATCQAAGTATISNYDALYTYTFSPEGPTAGANGLISGMAYGTSYTVTAKNISNCTSAASASFSIMNMLPTPDAPAIQVTAATCQAAGTATISNYDALYTYTFSPTGPSAGANGVISGFSTDVSYTVTATNISNCTSEASESFMVPAALDAPATPTVEVTAATCEAAGTATITNYNADYTYTFSPEGPTAGANGVISNLAYGTSYTVTAKNISNCTSAASASFSVMNMLPTPDAPAVQVTAATCQAAGTATISNYDALYTYTFSPEGPAAGANGLISGMAYGTSYTVTAKNISNCTSAASASFSIMNMLPTPVTPTVQVTAATCQAAGTATISNYDALYTYTFSPEGPTAGANGLISGMAYGTSYTVTAKNISNCTSAASASFSIMNMLPTPDAPAIQVTAATCQAAGTATISNYDALYTYTFSPAGPSAGANGVISGFSTDVSYTVTATNISNCTSEASESFMVPAALDAPATPTVQVTAATCQAAGTATISNYNANYTYTFSPTGPSAGANGLISGMAYGTSYTVTAKNISNCTSAASASFSIMNMLPTPVTPTIQVTAATCEAAGTATISNYDALYTYTFSPEGPAAGANGVISNLAYGTSYTVTAKNISNCTSGASASFSVMNMLPTPMQPTVEVTAATCEAAGTATISNYDALYTYTFSPEGPTAGANGVISNLAYGTSYTVTAKNISNCTSAASASFSVMNMLPTPMQPTVEVTAATCEAAGTATISNYDALYTYTFSPEGPAAGANGLISGMAYGTSYTVTAKNISNCTSAASASFSIMNMLPTPVTPTVQVTAATCEAAGTATISNYDALYTYTFSPEGPTAGANGLISGMAYGTSYTVTAKNISNCTSAASASFSIMNMLPTPDAPAVQVTAATCQAAGTATISNYDALYTYTFSPAGPSAGANGVISGFSTDVSYTVTATNISNCTSEASESFMVPAALDAPATPTVQVTAATCQAAGTATISNYNANYTYTFSPTGPSAGANGLISGMAYGTSYTVTAKNISNCTSGASASFSVMNMLPTPVTPTIQVTAATCEAAGTATISNYDALYTYTFSPEGPAAGANGVISNLAYGTSYTVTAKNISNCTSGASASFSVMNMLPTPMQPTVEVTAATCEAAGTATISNYDALYTYTFSPEGPTAGANGVISNLAYGTSYTVTAKNISNCTSAASASFSIMNMLPTPDAPTIQVTAATCEAAGTATISNYDALYTYTFSPEGPAAGANGLISGMAYGTSYTVTAKNISNCTSAASASFSIMNMLPTPVTPTVQVTAATCEAAGTATISNYDALYTYTFSPEGPTAGANGLISGMAYGTSYTVTAKNISNCTSGASASFSVMNMLPTPMQPTVEVTAATCEAAGTATISNYDALYTYTFSPEGPAAGANGLISGMAYGTSYTVTAKNISNCTSAASASFSIMNMLPTPVTPTVQVTAATCEAAGTATISNYDALYTYTFSPEGPTAGANGLISGMAYGTSYTVTAKNISNCTSAASASFSIMNMLPTPDAPAVQVTAATCQAAGTATISNYDALYTYTFSPAGPSAGANGVISGFSTDVSYTVTATNISNCTSEASESFMVPAALDAPDAPTIQVTAATCEAAGTATISNYNANYTYTFSPEGPAAGANGLISGMAYGTSYTVTAKNISNCTSGASASFSVMNMLPTPVTPTIQVTAATCEAAGTATISNYDALYTYTFSPEGPAAGANGVISNLAYGTSYTVTAKNISNCTSGASASFSIMNMLPTPMQPTVEVTAATCEAAGTATISNYDALYTYTFSPEGPTAGANGVISNLAYGTSYTVTAKNISNCTSAASASFSIMNMLPTPDAPTIQVTAATCEAAGTATISNYDALYTYTFSPEGPAAGANGLISGMAYGTSYTVTAKNISNCTSAASASFSIMNMLPTPVTPTVQVTAATCEAAGTATISNYDANYTYTFSPTGPSAGANGLISGMAYGTSYTVTAKNISNCTSGASASFSVMNMLPTPDAPAVQVTAATCEAAGTATISNYNANYTYTFSPEGPAAGANGVISNLAYGTSYTVTAKNISNCTSGASASFSIMNMLPTPDAPEVQVTAATCQAAGTATISNYDALYTYTFSPEGPAAGANGLISGMAYGTSYTVTATNDDDCISAASASFSIMNMLPTPDAPEVQVTAATCQAAGTATISNYNANYTYTFSPEGPTAGANGLISGMTYGTSYTVTAKNISNCTSGASASFSVMNMLPTPDAPAVQVTAATCQAAGTATISNYDALYTYTFSPTGPSAGANGVISSFSTDVFYTVTATNISNCTSGASEPFMVPAALDAPDAPTIQVTAATCEAAGTATISNYNANYTYTFSPEGPAAGANGLISGMAYGTSYTVTATNDDDCISAASASFSIMNMLPTPDAPEVQVTAATCQAAGTATISNYNANYTYTFSPTGPSAGANGLISGMAYGTSYTVTAKNISNCTSGASASFSVMNMLPTPVTPTIQVTAATCEAAGTATISNYDALYTYTFSPEGPAAGANGVISNLAYGTSYTVTAKNISNCTSGASASFSVMNMLPTPMQPTVEVTAATCEAAGTATISNYDALYTYTFSPEGPTAGANGVISNLAYGTSYTVTAKNISNCTSAASASFSIMNMLPTPDAPTIQVTAATCEAAGTATISNYDALYTYTFSPEGPAAGANGLISGMAYGTSYTVTAKNISNCTSAASASFSIMNMLPTPVTPTVQVTAATCQAAGTATISNYDALYTYTFSPEGPTAGANE
jgi:hypothetical protein